MVWLLPCLVTQMVTPRVTEVSLFQNGYAFVQREVDVAASGEVRIEPLPQAVLGTFRFASTSGVTIQSVVVDEEIKGEPSDSTDTIDDLLSLNVGRRVSLFLTDGRTLEGEIVRATSSTTLTFREGGRERVLLRSLVKEIASDTPLNRRTERQAVVRTLRIKTEGKGPGKILMRSLEPGFGWRPSYEAVLLDDRNLRLTGQATVANDLVDLSAARAELVTGAPNVRYADFLDPLVGTARTEVQLRNAEPGDLSRRNSNASGLVDSDLYNYAPVANGLYRGGRTADSPTEMPSAGQGLGTIQELFRHRLPPLTLRKGARVQFSLFDFQAAYREFFTWDVALSEDPQPFWRSVRFPNLSSRPLAAGPASTFRDDALLGQDLMRPTPAREEAELRLTQAADVRGEALEAETDRVVEPGSGGSSPTVRIAVRGTLRITNAKDRAVPVRIRRTFLGEAQEKDGATERRSALGLRQRDPVTELTWTLEVPAGGTKTLTYTYRTTAPDRG
ncbi:MAG: hypothetical protein ACO1SV_20455 [Fimbriimonas sp.]